MSGQQINVIIPAAGMGRRLRANIPKATVPVANGEPLVARQIRLVRDAFPRSSIFVVGGYRSDLLKKALPAGVRFVFNEYFEETNVAHSIWLGLRRCPQKTPALVVYGDLVFNRAALDAVADAGRKSSAVLVQDGNHERRQEVGVNVSGGVAEHFSYGVPTKWAQISLLQVPERHLFMKAVQEVGGLRRFGYEILNSVVDAGGRFAALSGEGVQLVEVDSESNVEAAKEVA